MGTVLVLALGCDKTDPRFEIAGMVTFNGQPLDHGNIMFVPVPPGPTQVSAMIEKGKYHIGKDQGLAAGKYRVAVSSTDGATPVDPSAPPGPSGNFASKELIPAKFNQDSTVEVEVKPGENKFDFTIP
jgi:hypothetical protein